MYTFSCNSSCDSVACIALVRGRNFERKTFKQNGVILSALVELWAKNRHMCHWEDCNKLTNVSISGTDAHQVQEQNCELENFTPWSQKCIVWTSFSVQAEMWAKNCDLETLYVPLSQSLVELPVHEQGWAWKFHPFNKKKPEILIPCIAVSVKHRPFI